LPARISCDAQARGTLQSMDFSSTELFVEILIAGTLFAVGLAPIIALLVAGGTNPFGKSPAHGHGHGHGGHAADDEWKHLRQLMVAAVAVALVYSLGVAGNRVVEVLYNKAHIAFEEPPDKDSGVTVPDKQAIGKFYAMLDREVRSRDDLHRDWIERHKSYRKILRAGSASSLIFLCSTVFYFLYHLIVLRDCRMFANWRSYCAISIVLLVFFTLAYLSEDAHYKRDLVAYHSDFQKEKK
jgi:hypothetical protein